MTKKLILASAALALGACGAGTPAETTEPVQCGPGTTLVDNRCVPEEPAQTPPAAQQQPPAPAQDLVVELEALTKKMCACQDKACAESVHAEFEAWVKANEGATGSLDQQDRAEEIAKAYTQCMMTAMGTGPEAPPVDPATIPAKKKKIAADAVAMFEAVAKEVKKHEADCDKMAAGINRVAKKNRKLIEAGKNMEEDAAFRQWFDQTYGERLKTVMTGMFESLTKNCSEDDGVKKALESLTK